MNNVWLKTGLATLGAAVTLASVSGIAQDNDALDRKLRELNIMNNIFEAAMDEEGGNGRFTIRRVGRSESMYLAGQGMVFSFRVLQNRAVRMQGGGFGQIYMDDMQEALERTRENLERVRLSFPDMDFDFDFDANFDFEDNGGFFVRSGQSMPQAPQAPQVFVFGGSGPEREAAREMEEAMRETQEEIRDQQREIRSLERELRNAEAANRDSLQARIDSNEAAVDAEMARLEEQRSAYEVFLNDLQMARQEQQVTMANEAADRLISTLCDYGGTLRSLDNAEHVTLILEDVVDDKDQVYVFNYSDVNDCRSADALKQNAVSYML